MSQSALIWGPGREVAPGFPDETELQLREQTRPIRWRHLVLLALATLLWQPLVARTQQTGLFVPRLQSVTPANVQPGSILEITLTGQDLDEPQGLLFSHPGVKADLIAPPTPLPSKKPPVGPKPVLFKLQVPPDMPVGWLDLRLVNRWGVSNPLQFRVSAVPETVEQEPNNDADSAQRLSLNVAVNGVITAKTDVDYHVFSGGKGQKVVVSCLTASVGSPLDAAVELYTDAGRELAFSHHYRGSEALLSCRLPHDGDYLVRVHAFAYFAGSAKHSYQLTISTSPWIDAVFPPVVQAGQNSRITVFGRNLPGGRRDPTATIGGSPVEKLEVTIEPPAQPLLSQTPIQLNPAVFMPPDLEWIEYTLRNGASLSNPYTLGLARAPVVLDNGDNNSPEKAQEVSLPCEIAGWIEKPRDQDWYSFTSQKGDIWDIDLLGDRIGSPLDLFLILRDARTDKVLAQQEDRVPSLDPPRYRFVAPADGTYQLLIGSHTIDSQSGPMHLYRLSLRREEPGIKLLAVNQPGAGILPQGGSNTFPVLITRLGDWNGEIQLAAENLPAGVSCPPQVVSPGIKQALLVFSAGANAQPWTGEIRIKGTAVIAGKTITQLARGVTIPSVYTRSIVLTVRERAPFHLTAEAERPVVVQGDRLTLKVAATNHWPELPAPVQVSGLSLPTGIALAGKAPVLTFAGKTATGEAALLCNANVQPGTYTLLLQGLSKIPFSKIPTTKPVSTTVKLSSAPITVTVLPRRVATPSITPTVPAVKIGKETEVLVKVKRLYDYGGPFKVEILIPTSVKGLTATATTIPAGEDQVKLVLKADPKTTTGQRPGLMMRIIAALPHDYQAIHEVKLTVNVVK